MHLILALALLTLTACVAPSQHDPDRFGTVRVALVGSADGVYDWRSDQRAEIARGLSLLSAVGPAFVLTTGHADVEVVAASLADACGSYTPGDHRVYVDAACTPGYPALVRAVSHEILHFWTYERGWVGHLCRHPSDHADCHPTITSAGDALLAPANRVPVEGPSFDEVWAPVDNDAPTEADMALVRSLVP